MKYKEGDLIIANGKVYQARWFSETETVFQAIHTGGFFGYTGCGWGCGKLVEEVGTVSCCDHLVHKTKDHFPTTVGDKIHQGGYYPVIGVSQKNCCGSFGALYFDLDSLRRNHPEQFKSYVEFNLAKLAPEKPVLKPKKKTKKR